MAGDREKRREQESAGRGRVEALSDAVFAVALTLLALELHSPRVATWRSTEALAVGLLRVLPKFASLVVSFVTICVIWRNHHRLFVMIRRLDDRLFWWNANLLLWISVIPFPTAVMGDYPLSNLAVSFYGMVMVVMGLSFALLRWYLQRHPDLLDESVDGEEFRRGTRYTVLFGPVTYAAAVGLAWVSVYAAFACYVGAGLYFVFPHATRPRGVTRAARGHTMSRSGLALHPGRRTIGGPLRDWREEATMSSASSDGIRSFHIDVPEEALADLRRRLAATRWPEKETVSDQSQGVQLATIQEVARYWATDYDWRKCEAKLNALPQFMTEIDGLDIHFIHVRSKHESALPVIITHGWPGSPIEQLKIIDLLANPTAHGASASDAFHVVVPSMPGYGFSGKPTAPGWDPAHIARAWAVLMKRLGYAEFVAQGGDWGAMVSEMMAKQVPPELLGIHTNLPFTVPPDLDRAAREGNPPPSGLSAEERRAYERVAFFYAKGVGYAAQMGLRPQTLTGLADSPVGLAAWMIDHDDRSYERISHLFVDGQPYGDLTRDDILDNITLFWLTNTALSSARIYWENKLSFFDVKGVSIPVAVSAFPDELYQAPRSWAERAYPKLIYYHKLDTGGHFAAWEQPGLLAADVRAGFESLRSGAVKLAA